MKILIINSKGHWKLGWFELPENLSFLMDNFLNKHQFDITVAEVSDTDELDILLQKTSKDTLIWTNAYYVDHKEGAIWINEYIANQGFPILGSGSQALKNVLQKEVCQSILQKEAIPIPAHSVLHSKDSAMVEEFILNCGIDFPMVLKPTAESSSSGVYLVKNHKEAVEKAQRILNDFPNNHLIVEEYLPSADITCAYLEMGEKILLMPIYNTFDNVSEQFYINTYEIRIDEVNNSRKQQVVTEPSVLKQLEVFMPQIVKVLNICEITRIDGRLDAEGTLRYFDVNGFPGLNMRGVPSDIVGLCFLFFPNYPKDLVYEALIHTIIAGALLRNGLKIPQVIEQNNLFMLKSDLAICLEKGSYSEQSDLSTHHH